MCEPVDYHKACVNLLSRLGVEDAERVVDEELGPHPDRDSAQALFLKRGFSLPGTGVPLSEFKDFLR